MPIQIEVQARIENLRVTALVIQIACTNFTKPDERLLVSVYGLDGIKKERFRTRNHVFVNNKLLSHLPSENTQYFNLSCPDLDYPVKLTSRETNSGGEIAFRSKHFSVDSRMVPGWMKNYFYIDREFREEIKGLLGNYNRIKHDDLKPNVPGGNPQPLDLATSTAKDVHDKFGLTWNVLKNESLFMYEFGSPYEVINQMDFKPPLSLADIQNTTNCPDQENFINEVNQLCGDSFACKYDALATCNVTMAQDTLDAEKTIEALQTHVGVTPIWMPAFNSSLGGSPSRPPPPPPPPTPKKKYTLFYLQWEIY
jgi:hypothetical protein